MTGARGPLPPIDFAKLNDALLQRAEHWLSQWLPNGSARGERWYCGDFDGSPGESANVSLTTGTWIDNANGEDRGGDFVSLYARIRGLKQHEAALELMDQLGWRRADEAQAAVHAPAQRPRPPKPTAREAGAGAGPEDGAPDAPPAEADDAPAKPRAAPRWRAVVPVPPHAPACVFEHGFRDKKADAWVTLQAVASWRYAFDGVFYGHVARYERINSRGLKVKDTIAHTWCENLEDGRGLQRWHARQWENPRPLYVPAELLSGDGKLPVVVVEGEKCAEAGHKLLGHEFDFVSWPGWCAAWSHAAWHWLRGRTVMLWPDCDAQHELLTKAERDAGTDPKSKPLRPAAKQPGTKAMQGIGTLLQAEHGCQVHWVPIPAPGDVPEGWDIADAIDSGWDAAKVRDFIRASVPFESANDEARASVKSQATADDGEAPSWRSCLFYSSTGAIKACRENAVFALDGVPERGIAGDPRAAGVIAFNEFTNNVVKLRASPWGTPAGEWLEQDELEMGAWLSRELFLPPLPRGTLEEAVLMVARRHAFHPLRDEMLHLQGTWDGEKRVGGWLRRVCLKPDSKPDAQLDAYLQRAGAWFLMGMCARVLPLVRKGNQVVQGPGTKFDYMLVFEGAQGWRKSTLAEVLGGEYFADSGLDLQNKDSFMNIQGIGVYEWAELQNMSKADVRSVKLFISSPKDRFRATFDRRPRDYPRQVVFVGTTNESHYFTDLTGNRRFWPVRLERVADIDWLRENRQQLLAEALHYLAAGHRFYPTSREQAEIFDPQQQERTVDDSLDAVIRTYLYDSAQRVAQGHSNGTLVNEITMTQLLERCGFTVDKQTSVITRAAGSVLSRLGWTTKRLSADEQGKRPRVYVRPGERYSAPDDGVDMVDGVPFPRSPAPKNGPAQGQSTDGEPDGCPV
jgi:putative DNA primase/helicase